MVRSQIKFKSAPVLAVLLSMLVLGVALSGQSTTGTLTGTVVDTQGAVIPGALVTTTNEATGEQRKTVTNAEGYFTITALPTGAYTANVSANGFSSVKQTQITFHSGDRVSLGNVKLTPKSVTTEVTVSGTPDSIAPTDSGESSSLITAKTIQNVSIIGRNADDLIKILPGFVPMTGSASNGLANVAGYSGEVVGINGNGDGGKQSPISNYAANGNQPNSLEVVMDGVHASDPGCNCASPVNANADMTAEVKVLQSNFSADTSKGPVVISTVFKSGSSSFHGEAYDYLRNYKLNSNEWLLNANSAPGVKAQRPKSKFNYPGFNIGGPVIIPGTNFNKHRDKLFFFFGQELYRQSIDTGVLTSWVPTAAMRQGDFSNSAYNGALKQYYLTGTPTGPQFTNGVVNPGAIDPTGQALINLMPLPNLATPNAANGYNWVDDLVVNQNLHQEVLRLDYNISDNTKFYATYSNERELQPFPVQLWWRNGGAVPYPSAVDGHNISQLVSTNLTHVFSPSITNEFLFGLSYTDFVNSFRDPSKVSRKKLGINHPGIFNANNDQIPSYDMAWNGPSLFNPGGFIPNLYAKKWEPSFADNFTKVKGTHTLKFGAYYELTTNAQPGSPFNNGFAAPNTWNGGSSGNAMADLLVGETGYWQEDNKVVLHNEGYRTFEFYADDNWRVNSRLTLDLGLRATHLGAWYDRTGVGPAVFNPNLYGSDLTAGAALPGIRWNKIDHSVPLSGATTRPLFYQPRLGFAYDVGGSGNTVVRGGFGAYRFHDPQNNNGIDTANGFLDTNVSGKTFSQIDSFNPGQLVTNVGTVLDQQDNQQPVTYDYSLSVTRRTFASSSLNLSYVGSDSKHLTNGGYGGINLVPYGAMLNDPDPNHQGLYRPLTATNFSGGLTVQEHNLYSNYNSLQAMWSKQSGNLNYTFAYTFSKALGIQGANGYGTKADQFSLRQHDYGVLSFDRTNALSVSYSYLLPAFVKGWMNSGNHLGQIALDGWQLSGVSQLVSGIPIQPNSSSNFSLNVAGINSLAYTGSPDASLQPVLSCDPSKNLATDQWIKLSCFTLPAKGTNGDYIFPYLRGPMYQNHDLSMFKNIGLGEQRKLQIRFSAFNFLNHPLKSMIADNTHLNFNADGTPTADTVAKFGRYTQNKNGRRVVELALKFYF